jgi:ATP-dependent DNA ligase
MLDNADYVAEEKLDGARFELYIEEDRSYFYSRRDFPRIDRAANVPHFVKRYPRHAGTVLDGEAIREGATKLGDTSSIMLSSPVIAIQKQAQEGYIKYRVFDILFYKGEDCRRYPLHRRREILEKAVKGLNNPHISVVEQHAPVMSFFDEVVAGGGEGLVLKNINNGYGIGWAKMKRRNDVSCIIGGYKPGKGKYEGMIGAVQVGVFHISQTAGYMAVIAKNEPVAELIEIGFASGMTDALRQEITDRQDEYIGRVVDIYAQEITPDNRLRHPVFHRFRDDVNPEDCTLDKVREDLKKGRKGKK